MEKASESPALYDQGWSLRTLEASGELRLPEWTVVEPDLLSRGDGKLLWLVSPPAVRTLSEWGRTLLSPVDWRLEQDGGDAVLRTSGEGAVFDALELRGAVAQGFGDDASDPMQLFPLGVPLGGPRDLAPFLLGDRIVATAKGGTGPSEQLALSLYRIARLRGGPFWSAVAAHVADAVLAGLDRRGEGGPSHNLWGGEETHVRLLADTLLLLVAHGEASGDGGFQRAAERIADLIETFAVPFEDGVWYLHDSVEREEGRNSLILNTHLHAIVALLAAGREVSKARRALVAALELRSRRPGAYLHAAGVAISDATAAVTPRPGSRASLRSAMRARGRSAKYRMRHPHLRAPGGWIALGVRSRACPVRYMLVNLNDLAMVEANLPDPSCRRALRSGLRYVRLSGFLRAQRRRRDPTVALMPAVLRVAGRRRAAEREARRLAAAGRPPAIGWPGHEDHLWPRLAPGTP